MKSLAIDFGERKIGLAISDPEGRVAVAAPGVHRDSDRQAIEAIQDFAVKEKIERIVVGLPLSADGGSGAAVKRFRSFAKKLRRTLQLPVEFRNEALTSLAADQLIAAQQLKTEENDSVAAMILLQEVLDEASKGEPSR